MGLPWISLKTNLPTHRKSFELGARLQDPRAWCYMVQLWCWAAENEPTGKISGERRASVAEHFAGWTGEPGKFVAEAVAVGFLEDDGTTLLLHDWDEHQGAHIAKAERDAERIRNKRAELRIEERRASVARASRERREDVALATRVRGDERRGEENNNYQKKPMSTSSTAGLSPAGEQPPLALVSPPPPAPTVADEVREVFEAWKSTMKHPKATLDDKRQRLIRARLKDGYSTADLKQAILGCSLTPFNRGDNKTKTIYDGLGLILRDSEHVDRFMANAVRPPTHADACPNDITPEAREFFASAPTDADLEF